MWKNTRFPQMFVAICIKFGFGRRAGGGCVSR